MTLHEYLQGMKGKTAAVIGLGVSNRPLVELLARNGVKVIACDRKERAALGGAEEQMLRRDSGSVIRRALDELPDEQRDTVILRYWHDMKLRDIAAVTGVPTATAKSRLRLGMARMRKILELEGEGLES